MFELQPGEKQQPHSHHRLPLDPTVMQDQLVRSGVRANLSIIYTLPVNGIFRLRTRALYVAAEFAPTLTTEGLYWVLMIIKIYTIILQAMEHLRNNNT